MPWGAASGKPSKGALFQRPGGAAARRGLKAQGIKGRHQRQCLNGQSLKRQGLKRKALKAGPQRRRLKGQSLKRKASKARPQRRRFKGQSLKRQGLKGPVSPSKNFLLLLFLFFCQTLKGIKIRLQPGGKSVWGRGPAPGPSKSWRGPSHSGLEPSRGGSPPGPGRAENPHPLC